MLSFRRFLLLENRVEFIKKNTPDIDTSHDTMWDSKKSTPALIDHLATADPTPKKLYTSWIVNQYKKKNIRSEDTNTVHSALTLFHAHKHNLQQKDINQYGHIADVEAAVEPLSDKPKSNREAERVVKLDGADLIHDKDGVTVHKLKTHKAACLYGAGTRWCTAGHDSRMFDHYNKQGPMYVVQTPDKAKYQIHFESGQIKDAADREYDVNTLVTKHPSLKTVPEFVDHPSWKSIPFTPTDKLKPKIDDGFKNGGEPFLKSHGHLLSPERIQIGLAGPYARMYMRKFPEAITPETANKLASHADVRVRQAIAKSPNLNNTNYTKLLNDKSADVRIAMLDSPLIKPEHIAKMVNDSAAKVRSVAISKAGGRDTHIDAMIDDKAIAVRQKAALHRKLTQPQIDKLASDGNYFVRSKLAGNSSIGEANILRMLNDPHDYVKDAAIQNSKFPKERMREFMNPKTPIGMKLIANSKHSTPEYREKAIREGDPDSVHYSGMIPNMNMSKGLIHIAIGRGAQSRSPNHINTALYSQPELNSEHIDRMIVDPKMKPYLPQMIEHVGHKMSKTALQIVHNNITSKINELQNDEDPDRNNWILGRLRDNLQKTKGLLSRHQ